MFHEHVDLGFSGGRLNACGKVGEVGLQLFVDVGARLDGKGRKSSRRVREAGNEAFTSSVRFSGLPK
jgi:hypothetical protein